MENKIYNYIIENYGINGWDYYKGADEDEKEEMLEGVWWKENKSGEL